MENIVNTENIEKLNYNVNEWYIANLPITKKKTEPDPVDYKNKQKKHSKIIYILCGVVVVLSVISVLVMCSDAFFFMHSFSYFECVLILSCSGFAVVIIMLIIDRNVMKKKAEKNTENDMINK